MPRYKTGNMLKDRSADYYCFTANSIITKNGELVMGAGIALAFKKARPTLPKECAAVIKHRSIFHIAQPRQKVLALQTKIDWKNDSPLWLVEQTIEKLKERAERETDKTFFIPWMGTTNGRLSKSVVKPMLDTLPDNVTIWQL